MTPINTLFNSDSISAMNALNKMAQGSSTISNNSSNGLLGQSVFNLPVNIESQINFSMPAFNMSSMNMPAFDMSSLNFSSMNMPTFNMPTFNFNNLPKFNFGNFSSSAYSRSGSNAGGTLQNVDYSKYGAKQAAQIKELSTQTQQKVMQVIDYAKSLGCEVTIISGRRTQAQQNALIKKYANQPGRAAKGSSSPHLTGRAVDLGFKINGKRASHEIYKKIGNYAKSIGMRWGGDFRTCKEEWHFDYKA